MVKERKMEAARAPHPGGPGEGPEPQGRQEAHCGLGREWEDPQPGGQEGKG